MAVAAALRQNDLLCYPDRMAVARITEIIASSPEGFREAVEEGLERAAQTLRGITGLEVVEKRVKVERGLIVEYRVDMKIVFVLE
jgi:flavin-binding protein dodecin